MIFHIAYVSSAATDFKKAQLRELLERSRAKNHRLEITGLLLFRDGNFLQVMEGAEAQVRALYETVRQDPRHKDIFTLLAESIPDREFPNWSMAFQDLDIEDLRTIPGYSDFLNASALRSEAATAGSKTRRLLAGFKERLR